MTASTPEEHRRLARLAATPGMPEIGLLRGILHALLAIESHLDRPAPRTTTRKPATPKEPTK